MNKERIDRFLREAGGKFDKGQKEHGGCLLNRRCLQEAMQEMIDAWVYVQAHYLRQKVGHAEPEAIKQAVLARWKDRAWISMPVQRYADTPEHARNWIEGQIMHLWDMLCFLDEEQKRSLGCAVPGSETANTTEASAQQRDPETEQLQARLANAERQVAEMRGLLRQYGWESAVGGGRCNACGGRSPHHSDNCPLREALAEGSADTTEARRTRALAEEA